MNQEQLNHLCDMYSRNVITWGRFRKALNEAMAAPAAAVCPICFEDAPHQGTCGSSDPRALCNRAAALAERTQQDALTDKLIEHEAGVYGYYNGEMGQWVFDEYQLLEFARSIYPDGPSSAADCTAPMQPSEWKDAVLDALAAWPGMDFPIDTPPEKIVKAIIKVEVDAAIYFHAQRKKEAAPTQAAPAADDFGYVFAKAPSPEAWADKGEAIVDVIDAFEEDHAHYHLDHNHITDWINKLRAALAAAPAAAAVELHVCPRHDFDIVPDPAKGCEKCNAAAVPEGLTAPDMRHILIGQIHNLIDLGERYSRLMHKRGDTDERDLIDGDLAHVRKVIAPYTYNGPTRPASDDAKAIPAEKVFAIFRANCVHFAGNYEVTPGQAFQIAEALLGIGDQP